MQDDRVKQSVMSSVFPFVVTAATELMFRSLLSFTCACRNLPFNISSEEMYDIFGKFGAIRQIRMYVLFFPITPLNMALGIMLSVEGVKLVCEIARTCPIGSLPAILPTPMFCLLGPLG